MKPQEKREVWWRLEADMDTNRYGVVYYFDPAFSSEEVGIWVEKGNREFKIYYNEKELRFWNNEKERDIKGFSLKDVLYGKTDLLSEIENL